VLLLAAACGTNSEDRDRLAALKTDGLWSVEPPAGLAGGGFTRTSESLADASSSVQGQVETFYHVGAGRWTDGYARGVKIRVLEERPETNSVRKTDESMISLSVPFHRSSLSRPRSLLI